MIKVITIEGASKSSTDKSQWVSTMVGNTLGYVSKSIDSSIGKKHVFDNLSNVFTNTDILFVAKSLGAIWLCKWLCKYLNEMNALVWKAILIDPHAPFPLSYGPIRPFKLGVDLYYNIENFYQRNKYPRGAIIKGAKNTQIINYAEDVNHFTIVNHYLIIDAIKRAYNTIMVLDKDI